MAERKTCSECGAVIPETSREGYCPKCLLGLAKTAALEEGAGRVTRGKGASSSELIFGNYELLEVIGEGGMGVVYKARQRSLNRVVALKMILSGPFAGKSEVQRFQREAQAAAKLQHPNVVAIHEVGEHEGRLFYTMDYVEGRTLAETAAGAPMAGERAAVYVKTLAEAVHYAHTQGILHRDLKPANVLLDASQQPRITDFGLAKQLDSDSGLTLSGAILGTPSYMPPEQARGNMKEVGPGSDIYSLGAILYELLTGRPPFRAETSEDTRRQVIEADPAAPRLLNPKVPCDLETICLKCLAKESGQRYPTAQSLADDLGRFLRHEPIQARRIHIFTRVLRWGKRNPVVAGFIGSTVFLLLMMTMAAVLFRRDAIKSLVDDVGLVATTVELQLLSVREAVQRAALEPDLREFLGKADVPQLTNFLKRTYEAYRNPSAGHTLQVENWMVLGANGRILAHSNPDAGPFPTNDFSPRDYFINAVRLASAGRGRAYVSRVYKSVIYDQLFKFGVSIAIVDTNGTVLGVISAMISTDTTEGRLGLTTGRRKTVIIAQCATNDWPLGWRREKAEEMPEFVVMLHPDFRPRTNAVPIKEIRLLEPLRALFSSPTATAELLPWYRDPVANDRPSLLGHRLTSLMRIKETPFVVICQTRDYVVDALIISGLVVVLSVLSAVGWWLTKRRRSPVNH